MNKQQLNDLSISIWDKLRKAVKEGDKTKALALVDEIQDNFKKSRNTSMECIDLALTTVAEQLGEETINHIMREFCTRVVTNVLGKDYPHLSPEERLTKSAYARTAWHGLSIKIEEDEEKFTLTGPCSTGGVLAAKPASGKIKETHSWCCGEKGISYYCTHCLLAFEVIPMEQHSHPWRITFPPKKPGEQCVQYCYKDLTNIPEMYYQRAGKSKAKGSSGS